MNAQICSLVNMRDIHCRCSDYIFQAWIQNTYSFYFVLFLKNYLFEREGERVYAGGLA